jgi:hypothetical protein
MGSDYHFPPPAGVLPGSHQPVHQIVPIGNSAKHSLDFPRLVAAGGI